jgi:lysophospholipase L1-like esterase
MFFLALFWVFLSSCENNQDNLSDKTGNMEEPHSGLKYLALGDSYTIGESVEVNGRFPEQLADSLEKQGFTLQPLEIIARTGWTTDELMAGIIDERPEGPYDLVTLLIGVNNQYRGRDTAEYRMQFTALLDTAIVFAGNDPQKVIVISIPDWGVTPFATGQDTAAIAREIDDFNSINREVTESYTIEYVDVTGISRRARDDLSFIAEDGLHPSAEMYAEWVVEMLPAAIRILSKMDR